MGYALGNKGEMVLSADSPADVPEGWFYVENWPTAADREYFFPGYYLRQAQATVKAALQVAYLQHCGDNFSSSADGTLREYVGDQQTEATLIRNALAALIDAESSTYYYATDVDSSPIEITLTASQVKSLFLDCQAKHAAIDAYYLSKLQAVDAVTDITQTGVDAVNAVVW